MSKKAKAGEFHFYVGIDYGTSTSKLAYAAPPFPGRQDPIVKNFAFSRGGTDSSMRFPSIVCFERRQAGGIQRPLTGFDADKLSVDVQKVNGGFVHAIGSPKMDLGEGCVYPFLPLEYSEPVDLVTLTLTAMVREFERTLNLHRSQCRFLVSVPASFSSAQREELLKACNSMGLNVQHDLLIDEPNAAFVGLTEHPQMYNVLRSSPDSTVLIIDFGAGTCDVSALKILDDPTNEPFGIEIVNRAISDYANLGGNDIDRILTERMMSRAADGFPEGDPLSDRLNDQISSLLSVYARREKERLISTGRAGARRHGAEDKLRVPRLKIGTRALPAKNIPFHPEELRAIIDSILGRTDDRKVSFRSLIMNVLEKAEISTKQVGAIVLAGGSAKLFQSPYVRGFLTRMFPGLSPDRILSLDDPDLLISRGAAVECYNRFSRNKPLIRPICPGTIGVRTAEGRNIELLRAGQPLPYPNQEDTKSWKSLFVPDPAPAVLRVPIVVQRFGEWIPVESWNIPLPSGTVPGTCLEFTCCLSSDKVLTMRCQGQADRSLSFRTQTTKWMHGKESTPREERITNLRALLKESAKQQRPIAPGDLINLINEEFKAQMFTLVRRRVEYLLYDDTVQFSDAQKALLLNMRGLAANQQCDYRVALNAYRQASALSPNYGIFHYNLGVTYLWNLDDRSNAEAELRRATQCPNAPAAAWYWYGNMVEQAGDLVQGRQCCLTAKSILEPSFTQSSEDWIVDVYKRVCDKLDERYPAVLQNSLTLRKEGDIENTPPALIDHGDIIKLTPGQGEYASQIE